MSRPLRSLNHGEYGYARRTKCPCDDCRAARTRFAKRAKLDKARGIERRVSAEAARAHVQELLDQGVQPIQIAHAAGIADSQVRNLMGIGGNEPAGHLLRPTHEKLMAVTYDDAITQSALVSSIGIRRRVQALEYIGYTKMQMAERLGVSETMMYSYLRAERTFVPTVQRIHEMYLAMRETSGDNERVRLQAYRRNYFPPMCWDDETIDDPDTKPYPAACVVVECTRRATKTMSLCGEHLRDVRALRGDQSPRAYGMALKKLAGRRLLDGPRIRKEIRDLRAVGYTEPGQVAYRLGKTKEYVERIWEETA